MQGNQIQLFFLYHHLQFFFSLQLSFEVEKAKNILLHLLCQLQQFQTPNLGFKSSNVQLTIAKE